MLFIDYHIKYFHYVHVFTQELYIILFSVIIRGNQVPLTNEC